MTRLRASIFALLGFFSGAALAVQDCDIDGVDVNPANGSTTAGKSGLMRCRERDSGELQREQELRNGKFVGLVRHYKNGRLLKEFSVNERGNRDGLGREFSPVTGKLIREETSSNGTSIGFLRTFHPDGQARTLSFRSDAGKELASLEYTARGQLRELRCGDKPYLGKEVDENALCGFGQRGKPAVVSLYGEKGELRMRLTHLDGVRVGVESYWDNGKLRSQEETGADGGQVERNYAEDGVKRKEVRWIRADRGRLKQSEQEFHESGALVREQRWNAGEAASEKTFYLNGQLRSETLYTKRDGAATTDIREFHDNGKLAFEGSFATENRYNQRRIGEHRHFDSDGRLRQARNHDDKGRLTREREFDDKGRPVRDDAVFEDGSRKAYATPPR
jgi:antitoxin component YwqK of YwqJK toxin-antitoxin module